MQETSRKMANTAMMVTHLHNKKKWAPEDIQAMAFLAHTGKSYREISEIIGHPPGSIELKMNQLKIEYHYVSARISIIIDSPRLMASAEMPCHEGGERVDYSR